jgi:hypothetical protein
MKYRKKPVVIEATQWFKVGDHPAVRAHMVADEDGCVSDTGYGVIDTPESFQFGHKVTPGDWIITGIKGEHYACKPDIFAATYEPAE